MTVYGHLGVMKAAASKYPRDILKLNYYFSLKCLCFRFSRSLKAIKRATSKVPTIAFCSKYYQNDFHH